MIGKIYALKDPINEQIRYIGQTRKSIEERAYIHWRDRNQLKNKNNHKARWLSKLQLDYNTKPIVILVEDFINLSDLNQREKYWINYYKEQGFDLTNTSDEDYFYVHKKKRKSFIKMVYCYDKNLVLQIFNSVLEASIVTNVNYKLVSGNANGRYYNTGYIFSFKELSNDEILNKFKPLRLSYLSVKSIDKNTKEEKIFKNQQEAAKFFNCNFRNINFVLKGIRKSCANQYWEYLK